MSIEYIPQPFEAPSDARIDEICMWLIKHRLNPDYDIDEALHDASVLAFIDHMMVAGWMNPPTDLSLKGLDIVNGRYVFK